MIKYLLLTAFIAIPGIVAAQAPFGTFQEVPFINGAGATTEDYISGLYFIAISAASILVVIRLIMAGTKYVLTDVVSTKGNAKDDIKNSLLGLLIILAAVTILNTINPQLTRTDIFRNAEVTGGNAGGGEGGGGPVSPGGNTCPSGKVWLECSDLDDGAGCFAPTDTSWCSGTVENMGN